MGTIVSQRAAQRAERAERVERAAEQPGAEGAEGAPGEANNNQDPPSWLDFAIRARQDEKHLELAQLIDFDPTHETIHHGLTRNIRLGVRIEACKCSGCVRRGPQLSIAATLIAHCDDALKSKYVTSDGCVCFHVITLRQDGTISWTRVVRHLDGVKLHRARLLSLVDKIKDARKEEGASTGD
jgi:hypothetical protein